MVSHKVAGAPFGFVALRDELEVPGDFASDVLDDAERACANSKPVGADRTDIEFVTIDPAGSRDLDQAVHLARAGDGYLVSYAIADVGSFVEPGSALDAETHRRGQTLYFPDTRVPLHPPVLSEGAASLLPDQVCPAVLWQIGLDATGEVTSVDVERATVRSRAQLDYVGAQAAMQRGSLPAAVTLLEEIGRLRLARARARHAINLDLPEQTVSADEQQGWKLALRKPLPIEQYNAEISVLTGMCAAQLMLGAGFGLLRTVPPPERGAVEALRRAARALHVDWPDGAAPGDVLSGLDRGDPRHVAFIDHAVALLRGAGYVSFETAPAQPPTHAGIGAPYTHVTAPLRRLVDRYTSEICLALHAGTAVPDWVRTDLPALPEQMQASDQRARTIDRAVVDMTEAWLLREHVGERFAAVVIDANEHSGTIVVDEPPVRARCDGDALPVGEHITARLVAADVDKRTVRFEHVV